MNARIITRLLAVALALALVAFSLQGCKKAEETPETPTTTTTE